MFGITSVSYHSSTMLKHNATWKAMPSKTRIITTQAGYLTVFNFDVSKGGYAQFAR